MEGNRFQLQFLAVPRAPRCSDECYKPGVLRGTQDTQEGTQGTQGTRGRSGYSGCSGYSRVLKGTQGTRGYSWTHMVLASATTLIVTRLTTDFENVANLSVPHVSCGRPLARAGVSTPSTPVSTPSTP